MSVARGTWVEIESIVLQPAERAPGLPEDTAATPYVLRLSGFLVEEAEVGQEVAVKSLIGRTHHGVLRAVNPSYEHSFGTTVPELLTIGLREK
ncbi:MAG: 2-amino-4-oxopentanoate thiolase subunit OrtA [Thermoanaerobaculia bacterium]